MWNASGSFLSLCLVTILFTLQSIALEPCQLHLAKILKRLPPTSTRDYVSQNPSPRPSQLNSSSPGLKPLLDPNLKATIYEKGEMKFSVVGTDAFQTLLNETNGKGFWVLYSPAGEENSNPVGHTSLSINDTYFTGQYAMQSLKGVNARLDNNPYVVAQFIELSPERTQLLDKFMNDRLWFMHQGNPAYKSVYAVLPFSRDASVECGENCITSNLNFLEPKWIQLRPELQQITDEIGKMSVSEIPNRQVWLNTQTPAYRGTVIVTHKPQEATDWMTNGEFNSSHTGKQLLFDGKPTLIK